MPDFPAPLEPVMIYNSGINTDHIVHVKLLFPVLLTA
ncbi:hypothetical protein SAMN05444277_10523 [Parafilimonas terrae]|uniref:Uncharacterized protein n=1 Tax=Parafilimonas terrae TaxID=1465490 RepID=A0A1I5VJC7_9BACT|nr:hypothetical protein SAMN05444277_10523 [Parafilimonas terrae]